MARNEDLHDMPGLKDTKTRSIFIITIIILVIGVVAGYLALRRTILKPASTQESVVRAPQIQSIPGVGTQSRQYTRLQQQQNIQQAQQALRQKGVAVPTLTRATYLGDQGAGLAVGQSAVAGCSVEQLRRAREAGVTASELRCRGCDAAALKGAGYAVGGLRDAGFTQQQLQRAGFDDQDLDNAGFEPAVTTPAGVKDCNVDSLRQAKDKGISAAQLKSCGAEALKAAGYSAEQLKNAGFTAGQLRAAGFSAGQLKDAGFTAKQLRDAGFGAQALKDAGFTASQLKNAGFTDGDLIRAGFDPNEVRPQHKVVFMSAQTTAKPAVATAGGQVALASAQPTSSIQDELAKIREQQAQQLSQQQWQDNMKQLQGSMLNQASDLFSSWTPLPKQQYVAAMPPKQATAGAEGAAGSGQGALPPGDIFKAGSIIFAVLDTGINSDNKHTPVMATIVQGKLKGAKLLGNFTREDKAVVLQFSTLSVPYLDHTIPINAYAIDPDTARTALASSVDSHYMLRYGTLFAASFLGGLGQAIQQSGSSTTISSSGINITWQSLSPAEKALAALGNVGTKFSDVLQRDFDIPPTVRVKAGSGVGILLMSDLNVPKEQTKKVATK